MRNIYLGLVFSFTLLACGPAKNTKMENTNRPNLSCDVETGLCTPKDLTSQENPSAIPVNQAAPIKLIYYYDALCGWCYGFSGVMSELKKTYGEELEVEVISGGLFLGNRAGRVNTVAPHIKAGAYKSVEARTGVRFGENFLADVFGEGKMTLNSLPPSIALCIVKEYLPKQKLAFAELLLSAVYLDGMDPIDLDWYADYAVKIGFDKTVFQAEMQQDKYRILAEKEFEKFRGSQFSGMPALVLQQGDQQILLSNGYTSFEELKTRLEPYMVQNKKE